jgi:hypothetical protein
MTEGMMSKIEALAARNAKSVDVNPCAEWDALVAARMASDNCDRSVAVDRCLVKHSDLWLRCQAFDARQPKVVIENGVEIKTGNWLNAGGGVARRIVRKP